MNVKLVVTADLERESGKFASREEIVEQLREAVDSEVGGFEFSGGPDGDSTYAVVDYEIVEEFGRLVPLAPSELRLIRNALAEKLGAEVGSSTPGARLYQRINSLVPKNRRRVP